MELLALNEEWRKEAEAEGRGHIPVAIGVGINTGTASVTFSNGATLAASGDVGISSSDAVTILPTARMQAFGLAGAMSLRAASPLPIAAGESERQCERLRRHRTHGVTSRVRHR